MMSYGLLWLEKGMVLLLGTLIPFAMLPHAIGNGLSKRDAPWTGAYFSLITGWAPNLWRLGATLI